MRMQELGQVVALLFGAVACDWPGTCKVGKTGSEASNCLIPHTFCYGGEEPKEGAKGICVYGELSPEGKPVAKITKWELLLHNQKLVEPSTWDKKDPEAEKGLENPNARVGKAEVRVGMAEATVKVTVVGAGPNEDLKVLAGNEYATCRPPAERKLQGEEWTCTFREGWTESAAETVRVLAQMGKAEERKREYRVLCSHNLGLRVNPKGLPPVNLPLAMSGKRLLFGTNSGDTQEMSEANNSLYVFDTENCKLVGNLHTGALQGPMVVLGDSGRVAVAINNGPVGKEGQRLSLVNVSGEKPSFVDVEDCRRETGSGAVFDKGLSLLSILDTSKAVPWRLVAPANHPEPNETRLVAYTPMPSVNQSEHCVDASSDSSSPIFKAFQAPVSQFGDGQVIGLYLTSIETHYQSGTFDGTMWTINPYVPAELVPRVVPLALMVEAFWEAIGLVGPAAIDSKGRVYYAKFPNDNSDYGHLRRMTDDIDDGVSSPPFEGVSVGSPILGEPLPGREPQVYLVTNTGKVLAYGTELRGPLWTHNLGIDVAPEAQPVLSGDTLWVVGARGEIRGIRVSSDGLSREAHWPKTFRDNCNTSSRLSTPNTETLKSCF